jgi:DNA mismatch repair protein MutL
MARIRILDAALADQIAAGEVIERPASVVKELLENALDAGARSVNVEIREGGSELIRVSDDGLGMDREDAALCVLRHATSKIRAQADLEAIATLGFRGEALPSIASVARFRLVTRTAEAVEGIELVLEGGGAPHMSPVGAPKGTTIEVRDLFFNVPARRKFLKSKATESAQIGEACLRVALLDHGLRLNLVRDGRRVAEYLPATDWSERAAHVLSGKRVRIEDEHGGVRVRAVLGAPEDSRSGAGSLHMFVNGRPVRERSLARSVAFAYGSVMPPGRYPLGMVHVEVPAHEVDVNVHPQKSEVRFQRGREVLDAITRVLAKGLGTSAWKGPAARPASYWHQRLPEGPTDATRLADRERDAARLERAGRDPAAAGAGVLPADDPWGLTPSPLPTSPVPLEPGAPSVAASPHWPVVAAPAEARQPNLPYAPASALIDALPELAGASRASYAALDLAQGTQPAAHNGHSARYRALAQSRNLFIVAEGERGLLVFDQHAADERVHYHRLRQQYAQRSVRTQRLLLPERVELSEREASVIESHAEDIARAGLEVSLLGARSAAIQAVPALLRRAPPARLLHDLLAELLRSGDRAFGDALDMALATMACHGSIRAGDPLSLPECQALLDNLGSIEEFAGHCPHGRPIVFEIPFDELTRKVGR